MAIGDMPNPFRKAGPRQRPPPPNPQRMWMMIYIMSGVLVMVVATMIIMKREIDKMARAKENRALSPGGAPVLGVRDETPKPKIEVPIEPLSQEGVTSFRALAAPFAHNEDVPDNKPEKETPEFINLLNVFLNAVTPESLGKRVAPQVSADLAYQKPEEHRGEVIRCRGPLHQIYTEPVNATTPNNVRYVYLGVMQEHPSQRTVYFYMPDLPRDVATGKPIAFNTKRVGGQELLNDWVEIEGVFLRRYIYPTQYEDKEGRTGHARSAVLFVKTLRLAAPPPKVDLRWPFITLVGGLGLVIAVIVVVAGVMARKYSSGSLRMKLFSIKHAKGQAGFPEPVAGKQVLGDEVPKGPGT